MWALRDGVWRKWGRKQALPHRLAWGTWPAQSHSNLTYTNAGGISEYLLFAPLVRFLTGNGIMMEGAPNPKVK